MLDVEKLDFVDIVTPPNSHLELIKAVADRGIAVLCQKPIASSMKELDEMIEYCEKSNVRFMVNENGRFQPWFRKIKSLVDDKAIGNLFYAKIESRSRASLADGGFSRSFFHKMPQLITYELGVHFLDTFRYLFGEAEHIYSQMARISDTIEGEDVAFVAMKQGKIMSLIDMSWASQPVFDESKKVSWCNCRLEGDRGTIILHEDGTLILNTGIDEEKFVFGGNSEMLGYRGALEHFVYGLRSGFVFETEGDQTRRTLELVFGAYDSAKNNRLYRVGEDKNRLN